MPVTIAKEFRWEMAHRLADHQGGCQNIHGHSYRLVIELVGEPDASGMVVEFAVIRRAVEPILDEFDHSFICDEGDRTMRDFLVSQGMKHSVVPFPTTAENLARHIRDRIADSLLARPNVRRLTVRLHETQSAFAESSIEVGE